MNNIFQNLPQGLSEEIFDTLLESENIKIERIVSKGHASQANFWYDQGQHEWVIVLRGEGKVLFESGEEFHLKVGDNLNIPAHKRHRVTWTDPDKETIWLAIHYS